MIEYVQEEPSRCYMGHTGHTCFCGAEEGKTWQVRSQKMAHMTDAPRLRSASTKRLIYCSISNSSNLLSNFEKSISIVLIQLKQQEFEVIKKGSSLFSVGNLKMSICGLNGSPACQRFDQRQLTAILTHKARSLSEINNLAARLGSLIHPHKTAKNLKK
jgi:hypothetical protein